MTVLRLLTASIVLTLGALTACYSGPTPEERDSTNVRLTSAREERLRERAALDFQCAPGDLKIATVTREALSGGAQVTLVGDVAGCGHSGRYRWSHANVAFAKTAPDDEGVIPRQKAATADAAAP